jgi:hypothetical protein
MHGCMANCMAFRCVLFLVTRVIVRLSGLRRGGEYYVCGGFVEGRSVEGGVLH